MIQTGFPSGGPTLGDVGERAVIQSIVDVTPSSINGDDAAVLHRSSPNSRVVATTDMLVEGRHFRWDVTTPRQVGRKAIVQNFADIEAMGARPLAALLSLSAPKDLPVAVVTDLARGIGDEVGKYAAELVGGDVTSGDSLVLSVTAIGSLGGNRWALTLDGARAGQKLVAHGKIGYSAAGLALLESGRDIPEEFVPLVEAYQAPEIAPGSGVIARSAGATSMTDNSDGLLHDLTLLAARSGVNIDIDSSTIAPDELLINAGEFLDCDPWKWVYEGGEDHTLLGTISGDAPVGFHTIGTTSKPSSDDEVAVTVDGETPEYGGGWESFA
ncbi:thiamine-phosphate kinase [Corynebacterium sp. p3-SID1194]|uniref:thiamine-phosphate kinase n=1 Tax=Corynebacterium sp. p3-SID1194 TaxID=2916105 RepID=UPI0021A790FA|nr:thiamine-phosphate kinase [Corynebacterium sp. p3-SID1194]MCT1449375.1 thiamine-phosphate kinase [Corynebacterium sp. p3-SID1194]